MNRNVINYLLHTNTRRAARQICPARRLGSASLLRHLIAIALTVYPMTIGRRTRIRQNCLDDRKQ